MERLDWVHGLSPKKGRRALLDLGTVRRFSSPMISSIFSVRVKQMTMVQQVSGVMKWYEVVVLETGRVN